MKNVSSPEAFLKFCLVLARIAEFFARAFLVDASSLLFREGEPARWRRKADLISLSSKKMLRLLSVQVDARSESWPAPASGFIVSNHLSYVDVLVIASRMPALFVTSFETRDSGLAGALCRTAGCLFVERRRKTALKQDLGAVETALRNGIAVVVFPEATSTDGRSVLPFRPGLYESAIRAGVPVRPVCVAYRESEVAYHGDMELIPHLRALTRLRSIHASFSVLEPVFASAAPAADRKAIAAETHAMIRAAYVPGTG